MNSGEVAQALPPVDQSLLHTRPASSGDEPFFYELYCASRLDEISVFGWDQAQRDVFLSLQFRGQQQHYRMQSLPVDDRMILLGDKPVGRIIIIRSDREIRLADIELLPDVRGRGIGSEILNALFTESIETGKPVTLHVEKNNKAQELYLRLGFKPVEDVGMHLRLEWQAPNDTNEARG